MGQKLRLQGEDGGRQEAIFEFEEDAVQAAASDVKNRVVWEREHINQIN